MTPGDQEALGALALRLRHIEATATIMVRWCGLNRDEHDALDGIAIGVRDVIDRLDAITGEG